MNRLWGAALAVCLGAGLVTAAAPSRASACEAPGAGRAAAVTTKAAAATPVKVWMAGDSTMMNASSCPIGWGSRFAQTLTSDATVVNSAVGGRSIQTWLYEGAVSSSKNASGECALSSQTFSDRWRAMLDSGTGMKAGDYLFVQFGINDSTSECPRHVGSARYKELLGVMASAAKARGAQPVFLTPVAAVQCSGSRAVASRGFLTETRDAGSANGVPVIDLHQLSIDLYNKLGLCPNDGNYDSGKVGAFFCKDHTHFEAAGAEQIAAVVAQAVKSSKLGLAGYVR